jgi:ABC-type transport system involved in cytochrome bd biosynthesis fused ATPase/permease subunit
MQNFFFKIILYGAGIIAIGAITIFVLYRLAMLIAMAIALLLLGVVVGPPIIMVIKSKYKRAIREEEIRLSKEI